MKLGQVDNSGARRSRNRMNAFQFAKVGLYVFPSDGKVPLVPRYNRADTSLTKADIEAAVEEFMEKHEVAPAHVGATRDPEVIKRMWRKFPDAVPSISCGPSKLVVLDADQKDDGPAKMAELFAEIGGVPEGVPVNPTKSGGAHYVFADPEGKFTNKAGLLKKQYGTDVRGQGGQFVGPGSIREDGKTYGTDADRLNFLRAITSGKIPTLPEEIVELIGAQSADAQGEQVTPTQEREVIKRLEDADWENHEHAFDADLGKYDLEALKAENTEFAKLYESPASDCSTNRFLAARHIMREWPDMAPQSLAVFFLNWEGAGAYCDEKPQSGEYDNRQIAREWIKNQGLKKEKPSNGDVLGPVDEDEEEEAKGQAETASQFSKRFVLIEKIRGATLRLLDWAVKFFVARGTTTVATGMWGAGKTAVFSDIGLHIGHGFEWRGRKVKQGVVIYVALENSEDVERRVAAWCEGMERAGRDLSNGAFVLHRGPCRLYDQSGKPTQDEKELVKIAKFAADHYGLSVAMIVIDTLAQSIMPGNDNDAKDAGIYTASMQRIAAATGANVTVLAHPTKAGEGVRGSGALQANVDTVIEVSRDKTTGVGQIKAGSKFRIGDPAKVNFYYRLRSQAIGVDEDGDEISVVLAEDRPAVDMRLDDSDDDSLPTPPDGPSDKLAATLRVFRERAESIAAETGDEVQKVGLASKDVMEALNVDRRRSGLGELKERTAVPRLLAKLVEARELVRSGDNKRTEYRLRA
ncbi:AAA family ATPase [Bradyrhizobium sp. PUT101]|uniref:AAA family ATPase n=1 Tax=Bradyrhizobium sp. PUT101 TaxID=3447427 RepID=UPI003F8414F9